MKILNVLKKIKSGQLPNLAYMFKRIWQYAGQYSEEYGISRLYMFIDYFFCAVFYGCAGDDYFPYKFFMLNHRGKKKFVTAIYEEKFDKQHNNKEQARIADDKEESFICFKDYMKRDWCAPRFNNSEEEFNRFYKNHDKCIIKPLHGHGGQGVEIIDVKEKFASGSELKDYCIKKDFLVEELIIQHDVLNKIFPKAINTIRIITLKGKCIGAALRMGVGEANVDNAHAGGIYAEVDVSEGVVLGKAISDRTSKRFVSHPTTHAIITGTKIPFWKECVEITEKASELLQGVYLIGWDVAITPDGPTFVEVNTYPGLGLIQAPNGHGLKTEFEKIKD